MNTSKAHFGRVTWQASSFTPQIVKKRYVRAAVGGGYRFCLTNAAGRDIQQGEVEESALPVEIRKAADQSKGLAFGWVEWVITQCL